MSEHYPERVWLKIATDLQQVRFANELDDDSGTEYIRADLAAQREAELVAEIERLRNERNAVRVKYEQPLIAEVERLREAIRRAPCRQDSIPCSWPCGHDPSEHGPCWKQEALRGEVEG